MARRCGAVNGVTVFEAHLAREWTPESEALPLTLNKLSGRVMDLLACERA